jgi:hypothetical protein
MEVGMSILDGLTREQALAGLRENGATNGLYYLIVKDKVYAWPSNVFGDDAPTGATLHEWHAAINAHYDKPERPNPPASYPVVMVRHQDCGVYSKPFLFRVPDGVALKDGDKVICDTRYGEAVGFVSGPVYQASDDLLPLVCQGTGATLPLRFIVGKYSETVERFGLGGVK